MEVTKREQRTRRMTRTYELETEDMEDLLVKALKLRGDEIDFDWQVGQWVRLTIRVTDVEEEEDD